MGVLIENDMEENVKEMEEKKSIFIPSFRSVTLNEIMMMFQQLSLFKNIRYFIEHFVRVICHWILISLISNIYVSEM